LSKINGCLISIIILNYNAGKFLLECVESIYKSENKNFEVILVDNASNDKTFRECKEKFHDITLIENEKNLGYCEGNNIGIRRAKGEFVVVLNPDTIVKPDWLDALIHAYESNGEGIYQPKILASTDHNMLLSSGQITQLFGFGYSRGKGETDTNEFNKLEKISYASGTCLFTSKKILEKLNSFDSFLFAYHDDLDLCWRGALLGINSFYVPQSIIFHPIEGYSFKWSKFKFYLMERNRQYCILTHFSKSTYFKMLPALILVDLAVSLFYMKKGMLIIKLKSSLNILKNIKKINEKYNQIQSQRKYSDKEILDFFQDEIHVPKWVVSEMSNTLFNNFLNNLSKITRRFI
tara:strand:+ start:3089 stop:4135 length:1047 start_codon:yes stop_codon:yes gene_type:complete